MCLLLCSTGSSVCLLLYSTGSSVCLLLYSAGGSVCLLLSHVGKLSSLQLEGILYAVSCSEAVTHRKCLARKYHFMYVHFMA